MSSSGVLGTLVIRIAAEIRKYQADLNTAASDTEAAAGKMSKASSLASQAAARMGGGMEEAAQAAQSLHAAGGLAALGVGAVAVGIGAAAYAAVQGAKEQRAYEKALIMSGNAAGVNAGQMADMAAGIDRVVGTQAQAAAALAQMAGTGEVAAGNLQKFSQAAIEMERATDQSVGDTVKHFAELGREPVKASIKLNESLNYLTAATFEQIKAAQDLGDKERAADIAQNAYADAMKSRAAQIEQNAGYIEKAWRGVRDMAKEAWDSMLGLGRQTTANEQLAAIQKKLEVLKAAQAQGFGSTGSGKIAAAETEKSIRMLEAQAAALGGVTHAASEAARAQGEKAAQDKAAIKWMQDGNQYMDRAAKLNQKIIELTVEGVKAGASQAEIERRIGIEREKAAEKGAKASKAALTDAERLAIAGEKLAASLLAQEQGLSGDFAQKWEQLGAAYQAGAISLDDLVASKAKLLAQQPAMVAKHKAEQKALDELNKTMEDYARANEAGVATSMAEAVQAEAALAQYGMLKSEVQALTLAHLEQSRELAALAGEDVSNIKRRIDAQKRLIAATQGLETKEIARESAKEAQSAWQKASDQINQSLSDALMNAFTAGKGFGKTFVNSIKAMFNTMVLRPVISAIVSPVAGAMTSALGFSGAAQAAGTGGSLLSGGSSLFSAGSALASVGSFMGQLGTGLLASTQTALGLTATAAQASYAATMGVAAQTGSLIGSLGPLINAAPYLVALAGVYMLAKKLDHSGTPHTGGGSSYSASAGLSSTPTGRWTGGTTWGDGFGSVMGSADANEMTSKLTQSIVGILDSTAATFGQQAGYAAATSFADDSSKDGAWGSLLLKLGDTVLTDWNAARTSKWAPKVFSDGSAGSAEYLAAVTQDVRAALDGIDLPAWADQMLAKLGASASLEDLSKVVSEINATQVVLQSLGASVKVFAGLSGDAVLNIINASGGLQAFGASLGAYYENFYSEQEKFDAKLASLNTRLQDLAAGGAFADSSAEFYRAITEPTRENFRKLIEAQDLTTTSGQNTYAALLGLSGVVAELTPVAEQAAEAVQTLGTAALTLADVQKLFDSSAKTLLNAAQYSAYRIQQIQATLGAAGMALSAQQIASLTREQVLAGYQQALAAGNIAAAGAILNVVDALAEVSAGFQGVTAESTSAAVAIQQVVTTLADVQTQFGSAARTLLNDAQYTAYQVAQIQATLGSVGINVTAADIMGATKEQVLAGLGEMMAAGNLDAARAILSVVDALSQVSSGFQTVAATASNAAAVMQQRAGLESTLLNLTGNTAAIRARELAALDASNRGLQQHIYAIQDAQQAIQDAQQAVSDATSAYQAQESAISNLQSAAQRWIATMGTASSLLDQISGALGGTGGNREAALWATVNGAGDIDARLSAAQELFSVITQTAATEQAAQDNALANAKALLEYGQRLRDYVQGLKTGDLSTLTPAQKVAEALAQYQTTLAAAQGGDQTALGNLQGVADTYLRLAREFDPASYTASVFTSVTDALDSLGAGLVSQNQPQVTLLQAQLDATRAASSSANALSADQIARLQTLQGVVQDLYAQAGAQSAIANAQVSSAQANLQALSAAQLAAQQNLALKQQALVDAQAAATAYMATLADVAVSDPVPDILRSLPEGIAAALAPLLNANPASTAAAAAATTAARAQIIRDYAATLPQDDTGARMLYDAAVANGVSSAELDAAMGFAAGSSLAWAVSHGLPAFAQGTNYVPRDMVAQIHKGEAIVPARYNPANGGNAELVAEIKALREEVRVLREQNNAGHQLGAMATHENTQQITRATVEAASRAVHAGRLKERTALA